MQVSSGSYMFLASRRWPSMAAGGCRHPARNLVQSACVRVEQAAGLTVVENVNAGPRFAQYRPHPGDTDGDDAE
jgi:hypothetical protein